MLTTPSQRLCALERSILRALCQASLPDALRQGICRELATYQWRLADHRIVFAALQRARTASSSPLREQLPAHATRMGFPDINWAVLFVPGEAVEGIERLVTDLRAAERAS